MAQAAQLPIISHYTAYKPRPFTREERDKTTILYGGLTWKHERLMQGALHNLKYNAEPLPNIAREDLDAGKELIEMAPTESLWQAAARPVGVTSGTFYASFRRYLKAAGLAPTGIHVLRHTAAKLRRDAGESIEAVSSFLDHSSLAVTTTYLRRLEGQEDRTWRDVAVAIGV